jgi:multimeric flavodoxin WrbA
MNTLAIVYHSAHGHTEHIARQVAAGATGFTVSSPPAGDKQSTLMSMFVFAMQHGMWWVGNPILPEQHSGVPYEEAANRLGSWSAPMAPAAG